MAKRNGGIIGPSNVPTGQYGGTASGVWRLRDAFNYIKAGLWPVAGNYPVANSLRFNSGSSDSLTRTLSTTSNRQIFTWSSWVKRDKLNTGTDQFLFSSSNFNTGSNTFTLNIILRSSGSDQLAVGLENSVSGTDGLRQTTQVFRDISAWYHIVAAIDTTQATASNRIKVYVNGSEVTSFANNTNPTQNANVDINQSGQTPYVGAFLLNSTPQRFFSGYQSEVNFIDGQALTPSSFGQTDSATGIWTPKPYYGTFGTNGFYLKFANSAALGTDSSGNANTFTVNNLTSVDQSTDTPTNNFATFLTLNDWNGKSSSQPTISEGNLKFSGSGGWLGEQVSSIAISTGKWFWEITPTTVGLSNLTFGIVNSNNINENGTRTGSYGYASSGEKWNGATNTAYGATWTANDVIGVAFDATNGTLIFYKNGSSQGTAFTGITSTSYNAWFMTYNSVGTVNFGSPVVSSNGYTDAAGFGNFSYAVPSGYYALCTKNLATYG